ncbi:MAG: hypothetical protein JO089_06800, partial [Alphaproteobacteria bacterium]|nr:hypothetical protein [Alphaproteobacteria bacterium]
MDLRPYIQTPKQLAQGIALIRSKHLFYQPFILADDVEVGEGQNLHDEYQGVTQIWDYNVYAPHHDADQGKQPEDLAVFRQRNQEYRSIYTYISDQICNRNPDIANLTVGEIGCNTGLNLFNMALRGAKRCYGYDWNDMQPVFSWLNRLLGTRVEFTQATYDNLYHRFKHGVDAQ